MIQRVLLTIRHKTPCNLSNFKKKPTSCVALQLTTAVQREVTIIFSKERRHAYQLIMQTTHWMPELGNSDSILRDFRNAPFYIHFYMVDSRMFSFFFLSSCTIDHNLLWFWFALAVHSGVIPTLMFFNNCHLTNVNLSQFENKHFEMVARCLS